MKKLLVLLFTVVLLGLAVGCETVQVEGITVHSEGDVRTIKVEDTLQLVAVVYPETASQLVSWESSDESIATVSENGLVTAVAKGTVEITATSKSATTVSKTFTLIIEEKGLVVVDPVNVTLTADGGVTTAKAGQTIRLYATVEPAEANQSVEWSVSDASVATVSRGDVTGLKEGTVEVTAQAKGHPEVKATITLTFEKADAPIIPSGWSEMPFSTHEEFMTSEKDTKLKVKGVVTHVSPLDKNGNVTYTLQNGTEGYYVYAQDPIAFPVELGQVVEVGGYKKYYNGLNEIVNVEYFQVIEENIEYQVNDLTGLNPTDLTAMEPYHCSIVKGSATFDNGTVNTEKAYSFYADVNGNNTTFRVDPAYMSTEEFAAINQKLAAAVSGLPFEYVGIMTAFGYGKASPQIVITKAEDIVFEELSVEELLQAAADVLEISTSLAFSVESINLPTELAGFEGLTIVWASDSNLIDVATGNVTHNEENTTVTLTATLALSGKELTKEFEVVIFAVDNKVYEVVASLDLEDALPAGSYGNSETKAAYAEGNVFLGGHNWMLRNALIAQTSGDRRIGEFSIRAQSNKEASSTARIELLDNVEFSVLEFSATTYGNDATNAQIRIEYSTDSGSTWEVAGSPVTIDSTDFLTFRFNVPQGANRVAIVVVENTGRRVNLDDIKLMK